MLQIAAKKHQSSPVRLMADIGFVWLPPADREDKLIGEGCPAKRLAAKTMCFYEEGEAWA